MQILSIRKTIEKKFSRFSIHLFRFVNTQVQGKLDYPTVKSARKGLGRSLKFLLTTLFMASLFISKAGIRKQEH